MDNNDERDYAEEKYNEALLYDYYAAGVEFAQEGMSERKVREWCKVSATVTQTDDCLRGYRSTKRSVIGTTIGSA